MVTAINDDLFTPDAIADPYTYFARIREEDPVHWNEKYEVWVITRYDDLVWLVRHNELFSSEVFKRDPRDPYPAIDESDLGLYQFVRNFFADWFIQHDRPEHTEMRKVLHTFFTPKSMEEWRPMIQAAVKTLLDEADAKGPQIDVMSDFATPLPLLVIAQMMGMPYQDRPFIRSLAEKLLFLGRGDFNRMQPLSEGIKDLMEYLAPVVEERMVKPGDDFISVLAAGEKRDVFTRDQVVANSILLLLAGHETTINLLCNGTLAFIQNPDQWESLRQDPSTTMKATEECLRYDSPVKSIQRIALEDVELRGKLIRKDDRIRWFISPANRDPDKFPNPDQFDTTRWPNPHVAFGSGIHHGLGVTLARIEGQEAFKGLAERYSSLQLQSTELEYQPSVTFRSLKTLPVTLNSARN